MVMSVGGDTKDLWRGPSEQKAESKLGIRYTGLGLIGQHNKGSFTGGTRLKMYEHIKLLTLNPAHLLTMVTITVKNILIKQETKLSSMV